MDPATIFAGLPGALKFVKDNLPTSENGPMFGYGDPEVECECKRISVFMNLRGSTAEERRRVFVTNLNTPLKETRTLFGKPFTQISVRTKKFNQPISRLEFTLSFLLLFITGRFWMRTATVSTTQTWTSRCIFSAISAE
jgi:hypothetical protein